MNHFHQLDFFNSLKNPVECCEYLHDCMRTCCCQTRLLQLSSFRCLKKQHNEITTCSERPGTCSSTEKVGIALGANVEGVALASHFQRIDYKVALIPFKALPSDRPAYLRELIREYEPTRALRSVDKKLLYTPFRRTSSAMRAFNHAAPATWNKLPLFIRQSTN